MVNVNIGGRVKVTFLDSFRVRVRFLLGPITRLDLHFLWVYW